MATAAAVTAALPFAATLYATARTVTSHQSWRPPLTPAREGARLTRADRTAPGPNAQQCGPDVAPPPPTPTKLTVNFTSHTATSTRATSRDALSDQAATRRNGHGRLARTPPPI
ncbi:hypothetical protein GCM10019016_079630 [Streptomyces prasinosporus]|uniref:Secreted protein n=1 Tax=Streptomyces prasinosporus TaxID=68256 RepID=A0ABP6TZM5_9ACTN|nr:hypothetical protein GCM10010332_49840 [Streptomyces albogriseolus]